MDYWIEIGNLLMLNFEIGIKLSFWIVNSETVSTDKTFLISSNVILRSFFCTPCFLENWLFPKISRIRPEKLITKQTDFFTLSIHFWNKLFTMSFVKVCKNNHFEILRHFFQKLVKTRSLLDVIFDIFVDSFHNNFIVVVFYWLIYFWFI